MANIQATDGASGNSAHQLIPVNQLHLDQLHSRIKVPGYFHERHLLKSGVWIMGASNIARSVICPIMERACMEDHYSYGARVVSTRSGDVVFALAEQQHLFVAVETSPAETTATLNGVITGAHFAPNDQRLAELEEKGVSVDDIIARRQEVVEGLASEETQVVFLTITKAGYNLQDDVRLDPNDFDSRQPKDWLDFSVPEIAQDVLHQPPQSPLGFIVEALRLRREREMEPFTVISCENLPRSGAVAKKVILALAEERDAGLAEWIDKSVDFIDAVVDRITPAGRLEKSQQWLVDNRGVTALRPVTCEPYIQLLLSNNWRNGYPKAWEAAGVKFMDHQELAAWRDVKQVFLNGSHTWLGFIGSMLGHEHVHEAVIDSPLRDLVKDFMREIEPALTRPPGFDLDEFMESVLTRFENYELPDKLGRVARNWFSKTQTYLLDPSVRLAKEGALGDSFFRITALWLFSMSEQASSLVSTLEDEKFGGKKKPEHLIDMAHGMLEAASEEQCHLLMRIAQSQQFFPEAIRDDEGVMQRVCEHTQRLLSMVESFGVSKGIRTFLEPLH